MKKNLTFLVLVLVLILTGAGCPLIKTKTTTTTLPTAPSIHMEQENPNVSTTGLVGIPGPGSKTPVTFASTTLSLVSEKKSTEPINVVTGLPYSLQMSIINQKWRNPSTTVDIHVPHMIYTSKPAKAVAFNALIDKKTHQITNDFLQQISDWDDDNVSTIEQDNFIDVTVTARTVNSKVVSLVFSISTYFAGAVHPNHYTMSLNYDLEKDQELVLADLFVTGKPFISKLSSQAIAAIKATPNEQGEASERDLTWLTQGAGPDENNFHTVTIAPEGFYIEFDPYDIDSYAAGPLEIMIPYTQLSGYVSPRVIILVK